MTLAEDQAAVHQLTEATTIAATATHLEATLLAHHVHRTAAEEA